MDVKDVELMLVRARLRTAQYAANQGLYPEAIMFYKRVVATSNGRFLAEEAEATHSLGNIYFDTGKFANAGVQYKTAIETRRRLHDDVGVACSTFQLGRVCQDQGYLELAWGHADYARQLLAHAKRPELEAIAYNLLGAILLQQGDAKGALRMFDTSLDMKRRRSMKRNVKDQQRGIAASLFLRAMIATVEPKIVTYNKAMADVVRADALYCRCGDSLGVAKTAYAQARVVETERNARDYYDCALRLAHAVKSAKGEAVALQGLARNEPSDRNSRAYHKRAVSIFKRLDANPEHIPAGPRSLDVVLESFV